MHDYITIIKPEIDTVFVQADGVIYAADLSDDGTVPGWDRDLLSSPQYIAITGFEIGDENYERLVKAFAAIEAFDYRESVMKFRDVNHKKGIQDKDLEQRILNNLKYLESELIDAIGPTSLRHKLSELLVQMRIELLEYEDE